MRALNRNEATASTVRRAARGARRLVLVPLILAVAGCASDSLQELAPNLVGRTVESTLEALTDDANQERIRELVATPDLRKMAEDLSTGLVTGGIDTLTEPERSERLLAFSEAFVRRFAETLGESFSEIGPRTREELVKTVQEVSAEALGDENRKSAELFAASLIEASSRSLTLSLAQGWEKDLSPAFRASLENDLGPGLEQMFRENLTPALAEAAREMSREALLGAGDALRGDFGNAIAEMQEKGWERFQARIGETREKGRAWVQTLVVAAIALALLLGIAAFLWRNQARAAARRERAVALLASAIHRTGRGGSVDGLLDQIRQMGEEGTDREGYAYLSEFLGRHSGLKVGRRRDPA